eukprot:SAG11_NODE_954_length_6397_cov_11.146237_1_plen_81_part_00
MLFVDLARYYDDIPHDVIEIVCAGVHMPDVLIGDVLDACSDIASCLITAVGNTEFVSLDCSARRGLALSCQVPNLDFQYR